MMYKNMETTTHTKARAKRKTRKLKSSHPNKQSGSCLSLSLSLRRKSRKLSYTKVVQKIQCPESGGTGLGLNPSAPGLPDSSSRGTAGGNARGRMNNRGRRRIRAGEFRSRRSKMKMQTTPGPAVKGRKRPSSYFRKQEQAQDSPSVTTKASTARPETAAVSPSAGNKTVHPKPAEKSSNGFLKFITTLFKGKS